MHDIFLMRPEIDFALPQSEWGCDAISTIFDLGLVDSNSSPENLKYYFWIDRRDPETFWYTTDKLLEEKHDTTISIMRIHDRIFIKFMHQYMKDWHVPTYSDSHHARQSGILRRIRSDYEAERALLLE